MVILEQLGSYLISGKNPSKAHTDENLDFKGSVNGSHSLPT